MIKGKGRIHTDLQVQRILADIRALMKENKSSQEIMSILNIPLRTYRSYTARINRENERIWNGIIENEIYTHLLKVKESFLHTYNTALALSEDPEYKDRLTALQIKDNAILCLTQILLSPPKLSNSSNKPEYTTTIDYAALAKEQYDKNRQPHP